MNEAQEQALAAWFAAYADRFKENGALRRHLRLKCEHGARVADEAASLAREMDWLEEDVRTVRAAGLLHDIGRFSQFAEFGTFNDGESVDHGERGLEVLITYSICNEPLAPLSAADRTRLLDAVRHHNALDLPAGIAEESLPFVKLVRDADKLDIYALVHQAMVTGELGGDDGLAGRLDPEAPPSPEILDGLRCGRAVPNAAVRGLADFLLWQVGWVFDINYPLTMKRLRDRGVLEKLRTHLPRDAEVDEVLARAVEFRDRALAGREAGS